ncbi:MAG: YHS domain-containing protein [Puia sp.]|nr:YHS domain-containing protein [Puia sp.]
MTPPIYSRIAFLLAGFFLFTFLSCQNGPAATPAAAKDSMPGAIPPAPGAHAGAVSGAGAAKETRQDLRQLHLSFAIPKDPSCGMPLTAGLEDTLRYKGKLYGFCSKECKEAFLKDPAAALAGAK